LQDTNQQDRKGQLAELRKGNAIELATRLEEKYRSNPYADLDELRTEVLQACAQIYMDDIEKTRLLTLGFEENRTYEELVEEACAENDMDEDEQTV